MTDRPRIGPHSDLGFLWSIAGFSIWAILMSIAPTPVCVKAQACPEISYLRDNFHPKRLISLLGCKVPREPKTRLIICRMVRETGELPESGVAVICIRRTAA
jgi:hypothetical protein